MKNKLTYIPYFNNQKEVKMTCDRTRDVVYNGDKLSMNNYCCSSCKENYVFEEINHNFCPFCGTEYKYSTDVSF